MKPTPDHEIPDADDADTEIYLLGQPPLRDYLSFVKDMVVGGERADKVALTDEWRAANDYYQELEERESGIADQAECRPLDPAFASMAAEVAADARYRETFDTLPTRFGVVELDKLIVSQKSVTGNFVEAVQARLGPAPEPTAVFRLCLPLASPVAPVESRRVNSRRWVFRSNSTDFRFHESVLLRAEQLRDYESFGPIAGVVGIVVGFGSNFLNVIQVDNRLLLHNGYHRACALRALGVTHAPAVIQTVTRQDELEVSAKRAVAQDASFYFRTARPPLLKDYFDPRIRKLLRTHKMVRTIEVTFEVKDYLLAE